MAPLGVQVKAASARPKTLKAGARIQIPPKTIGLSFPHVGIVVRKTYLAAHRAIVKNFIEVGNSKAGNGWVDYKWPNPVTKAVESKATYIEKVGDILIGSGVYK